MSGPTVSLLNSLTFEVVIYDSFSAKDEANYFGTLTSIAKVPAKSETPVPLLHPASVFIVSNAATNIPVARFIYSPFSTGPFKVGEADVQAMDQTFTFIDFITRNPDDPLTAAFKALWKDSSKPLVTPVNNFFKQYSTYAKCSFTTYMMGLTYISQLPASQGKPLNEALYGLRTIVKLLGGTWPSDLPDIVLTKFTCNTPGERLAILAEIDLDKLPAESDQALQFFGSLFDVKKLQVAISFNYGLSLGLFGTRLSIALDAMQVPFASSKLAINHPTATIDISPLFKFVVFTVSGIIPFNIFGKAFLADVSMTVDNIEASFGVVIKEDNSSLPAPPMMQGVHFDEFGIGIGIIFEPPGATIGLSGKLHIGNPASGTQVAFDDDTFVVVCQLVEEVPNPLYVSFYVPQMHLTDVLTVFTNVRNPTDLPILFTNLSFKWSENPLMPVVLPDGSLSDMGYGFSAAANIFAFSFYGDVELNLDNGLKADLEMAPLSLGSVFSIAGDGTGVTIKVDPNGNPIKNNQLFTKAEQQLALKTSIMKQLVAPGGPVLKLQTFTSPFLHLNASVSLFELERVQVVGDITTSGIKFELNFGGILSSTMSCTLADFHNLTATFNFVIDQGISLPTIAGVSLGSLHLHLSVSAHLTLTTSLSDVIVRVGGSFDFDNDVHVIGEFGIDVDIKRMGDIVSQFINCIKDNVESIFANILHEGTEWASKAQKGVITEFQSVSVVLRDAFDQGANEIAVTMKDAGFGADEVARELKEIFDPDEVAGALKDAFDMSVQGVAHVMQQVGYAGEQVAGALKSAFGDATEEIASALQDAYNWGADQVHGALQTAGFAADQIGQAFKTLGGEFADFGQHILDALNSFD